MAVGPWQTFSFTSLLCDVSRYDLTVEAPNERCPRRLPVKALLECLIVRIGHIALPVTCDVVMVP